MAKYTAVFDSVAYFDAGNNWSLAQKGETFELDEGQAKRHLDLGSVVKEGESAPELEPAVTEAAVFTAHASGVQADTLVTADDLQDMTVKEVESYLEDHPDERAGVVALEKTLPNPRAGVLRLGG